MSDCGNYVYHIAIIDYLTDYNMQKWFELQWKHYGLNNKKEVISVAHPNMYGNRFIKFLNSQVIVNEKLQRKMKQAINT